MVRAFLAALTMLALATPASAAPSAEEAGRALIGTVPGEWQPDFWLNSPPLRLADLRGKVILVRWWTAGCPYCAATAPSLRALDDKYRARGLVVVGMYHHKDDGPFDPKVYAETAKKYGFTFPLAVDPDWRTLKSWMRGVDTGWTSVTFLIDKHGVVRHFHPGGEYKPGDPAYRTIDDVVEELLAEK
jgi:peroxiredoxin